MLYILLSMGLQMHNKLAGMKNSICFEMHFFYKKTILSETVMQTSKYQENFRSAIILKPLSKRYFAKMNQLKFDPYNFSFYCIMSFQFSCGISSKSLISCSKKGKNFLRNCLIQECPQFLKIVEIGYLVVSLKENNVLRFPNTTQKFKFVYFNFNCRFKNYVIVFSVYFV